MNLYTIFKKSIMTGLNNDPRSEERIEEILAARKGFGEDDTNIPGNPYHDTRLLHGEENEKVENKVLVGLDINIGELIIADRLNQSGEKIDLVIGHRTECTKSFNSPFINTIKTNMLSSFGIPTCLEDKMFYKKIQNMSKQNVSQCIERDVDSAKLLDIPYMCIHTPADNLVTNFLLKRFKDNSMTLDEVIENLNEIHEFKEASRIHNGPVINIGEKDDEAGKIFVDMISDSDSAPEIYPKLAKAGYKTIISMHCTAVRKENAEKNGLNLIDAGHIPADTLGMNLMLDEVFEGTEIEFVECSGFRRFARTTAKSESTPSKVA